MTFGGLLSIVNVVVVEFVFPAMSEAVTFRIYPSLSACGVVSKS